MKTIQTQAMVTDDRTVTLQLPEEITPGLHTLIVVIDERVAQPASGLSLEGFPGDRCRPLARGSVAAKGRDVW